MARRRTRADAMWHARPHKKRCDVAKSCEPTRVPGWRKWDADALHSHASPRGRPGGPTWQRERLAGDGPTG